MTVIPELREQLHDLATAHVARSVPRSGRRPLGRRWPRVSRCIRATPVFASIVVVVAIVAVVVVVPHRAGRAPGGQPMPTRRPSQVALFTREIAALRRPQTKMEERFAHSPVLRSQVAASINRLNGRLTRKIGVTPWHVPVYVLILSAKPIVPRSDGGVTPSTPPRQPATVALYLHRTLADAYIDGRTFERRGLLTITSAGPGASRSRLVALVPDGVERVTFVLPAHPTEYNTSGGARPAHHAVYVRPARVTVTVRDNLAAIEVDRQTGRRVGMVWRSASGRILNRTDSVRESRAALPSEG
jgi:hypothetical protein